MMPHRIHQGRLTLLLFGLGIASAQNQPLRLNWSQLGGAVVDKKVTLLLPGNVRVQGEVESVQDQALVMSILKSSDPKSYAPGQASIPRLAVSEIRVRRVKGFGRLVGAAGLGALGSLGSLPWALSEERVNVSDSSRISSWLAISAASTVGGYFLGRAIDTHETTILVVSSASEGNNR